MKEHECRWIIRDSNDHGRLLCAVWEESIAREIARCINEANDYGAIAVVCDTSIWETEKKGE